MENRPAWAQSAVIRDQSASLNPSGEGVIQGAAKVEGSSWEQYKAQVDWTSEHRWRVIGADSIEGVSAFDYAPDSSFEGPQTIKVYWSDNVEQGLVQLGLVGEKGEVKLVDELTIAVSASLCRYYVMADWCPNTLPNIYTPTIRRNDPMYVCGDGSENATVGNGSHMWVSHRFEVYYYTESGARYKESWKERNPTPGSAHDAQPFYIRWHATVPSLLPASGPVINQTYQTDNVSYQPHYVTEPQYLNDTYGANCRVGDRIVRAQIYSQSYDGSSALACGATSSRSTTVDVYYGVAPLNSASLLLTSPFCVNQAYTVQTDGISQYATDYEFEWRDNSGQRIGGSTVLPKSQVEVWISSGWGGRYVVRANIPLPASARGLNVALYVRPVRLNGSGWGCDGNGGWVNTASYTAIGAPEMRSGIWFSATPVPLLTTTQANFHGAGYATGYQYIAMKYTSTGSVPVGIFPGNQAIMTSASPNAQVRFTTPGRYQILVIPEGPCGQGAPIAQEFTVGGAPTAPNLNPYAPYELGFQSFNCSTHSGTTWIEYPPLNPAWSYSAPLRLAKPAPTLSVPGGYRDFELATRLDPITHSKLLFSVSGVAGDTRPIASQYYLDLTVNSGVGSPITQRYVIEDAICRPAPGGGSGDGSTNTTVSANRVTVYPNPVTENELTVTASAGRLHWARLYDQQGNLVCEKLLAGAQQAEALVLPLNKLPAGIYLLRTFDGEQVSTTRVSRK